MCRAVLVILAAVVVCLAPAPGWGDDKPTLKDALAIQETLQAAIQEAEPSIACILVSRSDGYRKLLRDSPPPDSPGKLGAFHFETAKASLNIRSVDPAIDARLAELMKLDLGDPGHVPESYGSGVVIDQKGLILTNYHVVQDATKLFVRLPGQQGSYAEIYAADPRSDLAVLRLLDARIPCKAIKLGDGGKVRKGQLVLTIANPFAAGFRDGSPSASWGIVSNLRRRAPGSPREDARNKTLHHYGTLLQTDARLNLGCSGGALIDLKGELIGLTTAQAALSGTETAGGFAVPMDAGMRRIVEVLKRGEEVEYGFLGVVLYPDGRSDNGVRLADISIGSPAFQANLRREHTIVSINGQPIHDNDDLFLAVGTLLAGTEARLEVRSLNGAVQPVSVTLGKYYVPGKTIATNRPAAVRGLRVDYASLLPQIIRHTQAVPNGVLVREVQSNSSAESANLKVNDVITAVNGRAVHGPAEFYREAQKVTGPLELKLLGDPPRSVKIN